MRKIVALVALICLGGHFCHAQTKYEKYFSRCEIVRLEDDSPLKVNTGCIGATLFDVNGNGKRDLLVGEFGEVLCPGQEKAKKPYVQGRCRVYWNYGTNTQPVYKDFKWLETEGQPLYVPITCCVPMTPAFADMDGDGVPELFSGCYDGEIYTWKKGENGEYTDQKIITLADGTPLKIGNAATVFPGDPDGDGKVDLLVTSLYNGVFQARNTGTREAYRFEKAEPVLCGADKKKIEANHAVWYDWDGDGKQDIIYGAYYGGNVYWCRNTGSDGYAAPEILIERPDGVQPGVEEGQGHGDKPKICICDYDGDGKDDLLLATEIWETTEAEVTLENIRKLMNDERIVKYRKEMGILEKKMRKYTDNLPRDRYSKPDARIPEKLYKEWLEISILHEARMVQLQREEGSSAKIVGVLWVYYRK